MVVNLFNRKQYYLVCNGMFASLFNIIYICIFSYIDFSETNLKVKQSIPETAEMEDDTALLSEFKGKFLFAGTAYIYIKYVCVGSLF